MLQVNTENILKNLIIEIVRDFHVYSPGVTGDFYNGFSHNVGSSIFRFLLLRFSGLSCALRWIPRCRFGNRR